MYEQEAELLRAYGHEVAQLSFSNRDVQSLKAKLEAALGVVYNVRSARVVARKLEEFKPDIVHVHNFFPLLSPAVFSVCRKYKVPVVMTLHNYRLVCPSAVLYYSGQVQLENVPHIFPVKAIRKGVYRSSRIETASVVLATGIHKILGTWRNSVSRFIALTPGAASLFLDSSLRLKPEQLKVKPNFTADVGIGQEPRENFVLYLGRLTEEKGIRTLLQAHKVSNFQLRIIGTGPLEDEVAAYADYSHTCEYLGFKPRGEAMELLKKATALVFTSEWLETFGMAVVEAFATATPVVAAKIGGAAHLVQHAENGLHYSPGQAQELAEQVQRLLQQPNYARRLGQQAREHYLQHYTPEANYKLLLQIYEEAIAQKKKPAPASIAAGQAFEV